MTSAATNRYNYTDTRYCAEEGVFMNGKIRILVWFLSILKFMQGRISHPVKQANFIEQYSIPALNSL